LELILIPFLESSFDPSAQSPSNAAGLWQFISSTGKLYGLKQNFWYDGRMDVEASTDAALNYFTRLNKHFNGDWYLTLAAYNS
ncbi:transglycosylase SLT domain-containing protein, partial [Streptococcus pyogenes]